MHLAQKHQLQDQAEERLFKAYFTEGKNIDDIPTLIQLGKEIGLEVAALKTVLESDQYSDEVHQDIQEAREQGIASVPSFVFDEKLKISGAQDDRTFLEALEKTFMEWQGRNSAAHVAMANGQSCEIGEECR